MGKYFDMLMEDVRMKEGLHSCMNLSLIHISEPTRH